MSQTGYTIDIGAVAYPGQIVDLSPKDVISAVAVETIPYGRAVALSGGSYPKLLGKLPVLDTEAILGISVADQNRAQDPSLTNPSYVAEDLVGLMKQGRVYVNLATSGTAVVGGQVYAVHNVAGGDELGELTSVDDANTVAVAGAKFMSAGAADTFVVVELDMV